MSNWIKVAAATDVPVGEMKGYAVGVEPILLANVDGDIYALEDRCSHEDLPLSDGEFEDGEVLCIYHGARFDACTGKNRSLPAVRPVKSYPVEIRDGDIYVEV